MNGVTTTNSWLPLAIVMSSMIPGIAIFFLKERSYALRTTLNMVGAVGKILLMGAMIWGVAQGMTYETRLPLLPNFDLVLEGDALGVLFATLSTALWFVTTIYAIGYLEESPHRSRFFGFFSLCVSSTIGIALAGNLITFVLFYELLTLSTYPLVVHRGTRDALRAGRIYLAYTMTSGAVLLVAVIWMHALVGPVDFAETGLLAQHDMYREELIIIFCLLVGSLGVKAALVPLHGWLPIAMVAPAPVSALLHAVAVVKAGAFGIVRVIYDVYGIEFAAGLGVLAPLAAIAAFTIVYGSVRAMFQNDLKRRLAYSTISQLSYIVLGAAMVGPIGTIGGLVHLVHQGLMKITLFFCAGNLAETLHIHKISEMDGVARRMPWTMAAFTIAALGMIGLPPVAGFVSKWYLSAGGLAIGADWIVALFVISGILNAIYFLPIVHRAWFRAPEKPWPRSQHRLETRWMLLLPTLVTALLALLAGLLANMPFSPLTWAKFVTALEYGTTP